MQFNRIALPEPTLPTVRPSSQLPPVAVSPYAERFGGSTRLGLRPPSKVERRVCLRTLSLTHSVVATAAEDRVAHEWVTTKHHAKIETGYTSRIASLEASLVDELDKIGPDPYQRLAAHRQAFMKYVEAQDTATQFFLLRVLREYEGATVHRFQERYEEAVRHQDKAERGTRLLEGERRQLLLRIDGLQLQVENLERQLRSKVETLAELSAKHNVPVPTRSGDPLPSTTTRTLTDIIATQRKMESKASGGDEWTRGAAALEEAMQKECEEAERLLAEVPPPGYLQHEPIPAASSSTTSAIHPVARPSVAPLSIAEAQRAARSMVDAYGCELSPHPSLDDSPRDRQ